MNKKITISVSSFISILAILLALSIGVGFLFSTSFTFGNMFFGNTYGMYAKLGQIQSYVDNNYINKVDVQKLENALASAYLDNIGDKYAQYYSADEWEEAKSENQGEISGIGILAKKSDDGYILITKVYDNSPASNAGIKAGDIITKIDDTDLKDIDYDKAVSMVRGEDGSKVRLTLKQGSESVEKEVTRQNIEIPVINWELRDDIGYIKMEQFSNSGAEQFKRAVDDLTSKGAKGLILDLRNNGGGTLSSVVSSLDYILPEGTIGTEVDANGNVEELGKSGSHEVNLPMVALINGYTASASELFVCDLRDYNKAKLVGEKTYGKGVLQTSIELRDKSAFKITTAHFNPAKSDNFDGKGIEPDYEVTMDKNKNYELYDGTLPLSEDNQYNEGVKVLNSMINGNAAQ